MSGALLFLYDPVHAGSRAYFMPKMIMIAFGLMNAALYHALAYERALAAENGMPVSAKFAGALSLTFWIGVMVFSSMNTEGVPKLLLR
jgi:hypothetical protein